MISRYWLLERAEPIALEFPRSGLPYALSDVKLLALSGREAQAIEQLKASIESGWRAYWWVYLEHDPALEALRSKPEFQVAVDGLRATLTADAATRPESH